MEMSPKAIAAVTFPVVRKGYDPEQVRSFLSQLSRGVEELQNRALQAEAKSRLTAVAPQQPAAGMDQVNKVLVMAQRTADATVAEAQQEAEGIRREASERAESSIAEAKAQGAQIIAAAQQEAAREGEVTRARLAAEVDALEARRQALSADVDTLSSHISMQRERMAATVEVLNRALEHPEGLQETPRPTLSDDGAKEGGADTGGAAKPSGTSAGGSSPASQAPASATSTAEALPFDEPEAGRGAGAVPVSGGGVAGTAPFPAPTVGSSDPITQEVPLVGEREPQAWTSFFESGPTGDDRWKR
jgi:cell division initiation protein